MLGSVNLVKERVGNVLVNESVGSVILVREMKVGSGPHVGMPVKRVLVVEIGTGLQLSNVGMANRRVVVVVVVGIGALEN